MPPVLFCLAALAGSAGFYLLLAGALGTNELITAAVVAIALAALAATLRLREERQLRLPVPPLHFLAAALLALFTDSGRVGLVLVRVILRRPGHEQGSLSRQPFHAADQPSGRGRRALVTLAISLAPNGYVLDQPAGEARLLMHRLTTARPSNDAEWPT